MNNMTISAKTYDEAITKALIQLQTTSDHLIVETVQEGSSGFFGIGVYWVASGICRMIQQIIINNQLSKMDIDEIVRANLEKANEKAIKEGKNPQELKSKTDRLLRDVRRTEQKAENEEAALKTKMEVNAKHVQDSTAYYNRNAKPGSLAAKANMVAMYDERQMEKKRNKNKKPGAEPAVSEVSSAAETADVKAEDSQENGNE